MSNPTSTQLHPPPVNHARSVAAAVLSLVPAGVIAWSAQAWHDRLPDPLPTHWRALATPDGFSSYAGTWRTLLIVAFIGACFGIAAAALAWLNPLLQRSTAALGAALAFGALGVWLATAHAAWGRADATGAPLGWAVVLPVLGVALGLVGALLVVGRRPHTVHTVPVAAGSSSGLVLAPGERAMWAHRTFMVWPLVVAGALAGGGVVVWFTADAVPALVLAVAAVTAAVLAWVQVTVDARGLRIGLGPWAWTVKNVPRAAIASARAQSTAARDWGGWGYRVLPGRSAVVLHSGPAIVLELADGRRFAVTVDDPETPVALLDALRVRAAG
jgi:hypothetical protein